MEPQSSRSRGGRVGFVSQFRSASRKKTFFGGANAVGICGCVSLARKNRVQTMSFSCPFRACFVPGSCRGGGLGCPEGGVTRDATCARIGRWQLRTGRKRSPPWSYPPVRGGAPGRVDAHARPGTVHPYYARWMSLFDKL